MNPQILCKADNYDQGDHEWRKGEYSVKNGELTYASDPRGAMRSQALKRAAKEQITKENDTYEIRPCYVLVRAGTNLIDAIAIPAPAEQPEEERGAGPAQATKQQEPAAAEERPAGTTTPAAERREEPRPEKQAYDYTPLLKCREIVEQACFGGFEITLSRKKDKTHKYDKKPKDIDPQSRKEGEKDGVYRFVHTAEKALEIINGMNKTAGVQYALGIRFGAILIHDGEKYTLIGVDIDGGKKLHKDKDGTHQIENITSFLEYTGRRGFLAVEFRCGQKNEAYLMSWETVLGFFASQASITIDEFRKCTPLKRTGGGYQLLPPL